MTKWFVCLNISRDGDLSSPGNLFQCSTTLLVEMFYYVQMNFFECFNELLTRAIFRAIFTILVSLDLLSWLYCMIQKSGFM